MSPADRKQEIPVVCRSAWRASYRDGRTSHTFDGGHDLLFVLRGKSTGVESSTSLTTRCAAGGRSSVLLEMLRNFKLRLVRDLRVLEDPADERRLVVPDPDVAETLTGYSHGAEEGAEAEQDGNAACVGPSTKTPTAPAAPPVRPITPYAARSPLLSGFP
jgi:hypothetical protein